MTALLNKIRSIPHNQPSLSEPRKNLKLAIEQLNRIVLGKEKQVRLAMACVLAGGHLLIEDIPGTGKTILARAMGATLNLDFKRIQFTSDLMPSDILGVSIYRPNDGEFHLIKGPIFTNILLADEINRATPRAQSALLEAMAEGQVSIDQDTIKLTKPFMVIATQNHLDMAGTFPLPAAQKDRFLFQISMGYPDRENELSLMRGSKRSELLESDLNGTQLNLSDLLTLQQETQQIKFDDALMDFTYDLVSETRKSEHLDLGLSTRGSLALVEAAKALALLSERSYVIPEDIQEAFMPLTIHRIQPRSNMIGQEKTILEDIVNSVPIP